MSSFEVYDIRPRNPEGANMRTLDLLGRALMKDGLARIPVRPASRLPYLLAARRQLMDAMGLTQTKDERDLLDVAVAAVDDACSLIEWRDG